MANRHTNLYSKVRNSTFLKRMKRLFEKMSNVIWLILIMFVLALLLVPDHWRSTLGIFGVAIILLIVLALLYPKLLLFLKWVFNSNAIKRFYGHFKEFPYIWVLLGALFIIAWLISPTYWLFSLKLFGITFALLTALVLIRPMNAVYGLMGTAGSIRLFFFNFLFITLLFSGIYHLAFFKDAGISYDVNQPHIDYRLYAGRPKVDTIKISEKRDTLFFERQIDTIAFKESIVRISRDTIHYQNIDFWQVWRSSILTTLTQEPADLLATASVHNSAMESTDVVVDKQKSSYFEWILIFHIIISWIFFGVFISLLYNKFRYES